MTEMRAILALEDGTVFEGVSFGASLENKKWYQASLQISGYLCC